ncbi:MAG: hypothetical protein AAB875_02660, partial [Patescibacteria group bacterium]
ISIWDVYNFIAAVGSVKAWKLRSNIVIAGGWGLRNVAPLRHIIDFAVFGRGENTIVELIETILKGRDIKIDNVMNLKSYPTPVTFDQAKELYPHEIDSKPIKYKEFSLGCPRQCWFCIYTFARKFLKDGQDPYYETSTKFQMSKELIITDIKRRWNGQSVNLRTSIDGWSERLRLAFNKKIYDEDIIEAIEAASIIGTSNPTHINTYMICGYPTETNEEKDKFIDLLSQAHPVGNKIVLKLILVPFRPAPLTPSAWLPADILTNWKRITTNVEVIRSPKYDVSYENKSIESPWSLLQSLIIERATENSDEIIKMICFSKALDRLCAKGKVDALGNNFNLDSYTREYHIGIEQIPTWYIDSYIPNETIQRMAKTLKLNLGMEVPCCEAGEKVE